MKGLIALDIDGTITADHHAIDTSVVDYLCALASEGWQLFFITGRTYAWGLQLLSTLPFSFYYGSFNGALVVHFPTGEVVVRKYLHSSILAGVEALCIDGGVEFIVYTDVEGETVCYYCPHRLDAGLSAYVSMRRVKAQEKWVPLNSLSSLPVSEFPALKCFGTLESNLFVASRIQKILPFHAPVIQDPFNTAYSVLQLTSIDVTKGTSVLQIAKHLKCKGRVIAAGDDYNDESMLAIADVAVVMATAPSPLQGIADIIAPPAFQNGIIDGLSKAIQHM